MAQKRPQFLPGCPSNKTNTIKLQCILVVQAFQFCLILAVQCLLVREFVQPTPITKLRTPFSQMLSLAPFVIAFKIITWDRVVTTPITLFHLGTEIETAKMGTGIQITLALTTLQWTCMPTALVMNLLTETSVVKVCGEKPKLQWAVRCMVPFLVIYTYMALFVSGLSSKHVGFFVCFCYSSEPGGSYDNIIIWLVIMGQKSGDVCWYRMYWVSLLFGLLMPIMAISLIHQ